MSAPEEGLPPELRYALYADVSAQMAADQGFIADGSVVVDLTTGATGRVSSVYGDGSAYVVFPGGGRMVQPWEMSLADDQDQQREGGPDE
jgi:hypothetical protein